MIESGQLFTLTRQAFFPFGTFGVMEINGTEIFFCEPPWKNNLPFESCIPDGFYTVTKFISKKYGECWILNGGTVGGKGTHPRYGILIHAANWPDQLKGCLAPGLALQPIPILKRNWPQSLGVVGSKNAMAFLNEEMPDYWNLEIKSINAH